MVRFLCTATRFLVGRFELTNVYICNECILMHPQLLFVHVPLAFRANLEFTGALITSYSNKSVPIPRKKKGTIEPDA